MKTMIQLLLVLFVLVSMGGCSAIQELQERVKQAEQDLNASKMELIDARNNFELLQKDLDKKQVELEAAIEKGDFETATRLKDDVSDAREKVAVANEKVKQAEEKVDLKEDAKKAAETQFQNAEDPMDYVLGGLALIASFFGVGGTVNSMRANRKVKKLEGNASQ